MARFSLKQMLGFTAVSCVAIFALNAMCTRRIRTKLQARAVAKEDWRTHAVVYKWHPTEKMVNRLLIRNHVERSTGMMIVMRPKSDFSATYNLEVQNLFEKNGAPPYSLAPILPKDSLICSEFHSNEFSQVSQFPVDLTPRIKIGLDSALRIETKGTEYHEGISMTVDYGKSPVNIRRKGDICFIRYGKWMGVFHADGRLLFGVTEQEKESATVLN